MWQATGFSSSKIERIDTICFSKCMFFGSLVVLLFLSQQCGLAFQAWSDLVLSLTQKVNYRSLYRLSLSIASGNERSCPQLFHFWISEFLSWMFSQPSQPVQLRLDSTEQLICGVCHYASKTVGTWLLWTGAIVQDWWFCTPNLANNVVRCCILVRAVVSNTFCQP